MYRLLWPKLSIIEFIIGNIHIRIRASTLWKPGALVSGRGSCDVLCVPSKDE